MKAHFELKNIIYEIDGEDHGQGRSLIGEYLFNKYTLFIDDLVLSEPEPVFNVRARIAQDTALFPDDTYSSRAREIALRDYITRRFNENCSSRKISIETPGQEILGRTSVLIDNNFLEVRFKAVLHWAEGKINSKETDSLFFEELPVIVESSALFQNLDKDLLYKHIETNEDADFLRAELENIRLIAFVAEGSRLPTGDGGFMPFTSPENLKMDVELPNLGQITGLGIPRGITFILGEDSQAKSAILDAISEGIYNHVPGDGREYAVSNPNSVKINNETGRRIRCVNISAFTNDSESSACFSSDNADYIEAQAANIVEAVEVGADVLLIDQDGIDSYIEKASALYNEYMVSSIVAAEEMDEYYGIANYIIQTNDNQAKDMALEGYDESAGNSAYSPIGHIAERIPLAESIDLSEVELSSLEHIVSDTQRAAITDAINYAKKYMDGKKSFRQVCSLVMLDIGRSGLDILSTDPVGDYAEFRKIELAAAINRLKSLKVSQK